MEFNEEDYLMLSGVQHYFFCKRQWALIHIEQQWAENYRTTSGNIMHKRAHQEDSFELRGNLLTARGLRIFSRKLGVSGQCDIVEFHKCDDGINLRGYEGKWRIVPVEYKRGMPKEGQEDVMQLCLQAMCLEEMFLTNITGGFLYYGESRHRMAVEFTKDIREKLVSTIMEMHELYHRGHTPMVKTGKKCQACSLVEICIPKMQKLPTPTDYIRMHMNEKGEDK